MRNIFRLVFAVLCTGVLAMVAPIDVKADTVGPYYATPSWDQTLPPATRFIVLSNFASAAVLDRETGLVWEKSPSGGTHIWRGARANCVNSSVGGRKGWRLPSIEELTSLVDPAVPSPGPMLTPGHPFTNVRGSRYWSATVSVENPDRAWYVDFGEGSVESVDKTSEDTIAWCVRGVGPLSTY